MSTPVFSATGVLRSIKPQKRNPLNHCCLMNGGLISSQFPTGTSTGARCSAAPNTRRCASPALTATSRVGQQTGHWGPNPLRGFWDTPGAPWLAGRRERAGPRPILSVNIGKSVCVHNLGIEHVDSVCVPIGMASGYKKKALRRDPLVKAHLADSSSVERVGSRGLKEVGLASHVARRTFITGC